MFGLDVGFVTQFRCVSLVGRLWVRAHCRELPSTRQGDTKVALAALRLVVGLHFLDAEMVAVLADEIQFPDLDVCRRVECLDDEVGELL